MKERTVRTAPGVGLLALIFQATLPGQTVIGSITRPGFSPSAVAVYETVPSSRR